MTKEENGSVQTIRKDGKGIKVNDIWYSNFHDKVSCKVGDSVKITYNENEKDGTIYRNWTDIEVTMQTAKSVTESVDNRKNVDAGNIVQRAVEMTIAVVNNSKETVSAPQVFQESLDILTKAFIETKSKL